MSFPPASFTPDDSDAPRRAHARFLGALLSLATITVAVWLALNTDNAHEETTRSQLLVAVIALLSFLISMAFYLAAAAATGRRRGDFEADRVARADRSVRSLSAAGAIFASVALLLIAGLGILRIFAPPAERPVSVQFSEITGRVQLQYCPTLPGSFEALVKPADLASSSTVLPVWVSNKVCGNPNFYNGVWLYLNRATITIADAGNR